MPHKLGHGDLNSDKSLIKFLYNNPDQFYKSLLSAVPEISILLEITGAYMFSKMNNFFVFSNRAQPYH